MKFDFGFGSPALAPEIANLRQRMSSGTISDFSSVDHNELSTLANVLAITAHQLSRQAAPAAHEIQIPEDSDTGL